MCSGVSTLDLEENEAATLYWLKVSPNVCVIVIAYTSPATREHCHTRHHIDLHVRTCTCSRVLLHGSTDIHVHVHILKMYEESKALLDCSGMKTGK